MKKILFKLILSGIVLLLFSCTKQDESLPGSEDFAKHPVLWKKEFGNRACFAPILDDKGNVYVMLYEVRQGCVEVSNNIAIASFSPDGEKRWEKYFPQQYRAKMYYADGKLFFTVAYEDENQEKHKFLVILDASNGEKILSISFSKKLYRPFLYDFYVSKGRIYVAGNQLIAYTFSGEMLWHTNIECEEKMKMLAKGEEIYLNYTGKLVKYRDMGNSCEYQWTWEDASSQDPYSTLQFGEQNNIYRKSGERLYNISTVDGHTIHSINGLADYSCRVFREKEIVGVVHYPSKLCKFDMEGNILWSLPLSDEVASRQDCRNFSLSENGNVYCGTKYGLFAIDSSGSQMWHVGVYQDISNLHELLITSEGNLLCYSPERKYLLCIKGDGSPAQ